MSQHSAQHEPQSSSGPQGDEPGFWRSRYGLGLVVIGAAALYFLLTEHREHFFSALPLLILLACPLMHLFMHGGHGGHGGRADQGAQARSDCCAPSQDTQANEKPAQPGEKT